MSNWLERAEMLLGSENLATLAASKVMVVGLGGVGGAAIEFLARAGVGTLVLVDGDTVQASNRNRQLLSLHSNTGEKKAHLAAARCRDINPDIRLHVVDYYVPDEQMHTLFEIEKIDYVIDAIDTLAPKIRLIAECHQRQIPLVSSMGAGGKTNPALVKVADIHKTFNDKLARALRKRLHRMGIYKGFQAVFSSEDTQGEVIVTEGEQNKKSNVGTISYMPPLFGLMCASTVIRRLTQLEGAPQTAPTEPEA